MPVEIAELFLTSKAARMLRYLRLLIGLWTIVLRTLWVVALADNRTQFDIHYMLKGVRKTRDKDEADWKAWQSAKSKAAGMGGTKADAERAKKLEKLPYVKARIKKMRDKQQAQSKPQRGG